MRSYGAANAAQRTGRSWGIATAIMVLAGSVAVASVGYTLFTLSSLRSVAIDDAEVATFSGAADAPRTLRADAALDESNEAEEVNLLRRLEGRVEKMLGSLAGSAAAAAKRSSGDSAAALSEASIKALSDRLESLASQITELPGRVKDAVVEGLPKTVAAPASAPAATKPVAAVASTKNRNLVLGMAKNIELPNLYRFVRSLRVHGGDNVDIVIFTDEVSGPHEWVYGAFSVTVVKFAVAEFPTKVQGFHPSSYRWILMRDWMRSALEKAGSGAGAPYDNVLFIDVRDSVFQRDPFAHLEGAPGFYAFLEAKPRTIAECGWNAGWVRGECGLPTESIACCESSASLDDRAPCAYPAPQSLCTLHPSPHPRRLLWRRRACCGRQQRHHVQRYVHGQLGRCAGLCGAGGRRDREEPVRAQRCGPGHAQLLRVRR